jgi:hypothetical protein
MLSINSLKQLSGAYDVPFEDVLFIALNVTGVDYDCGYDRMRGQLHLDNVNLFSYAESRKDLDFYFALPVHSNSPFKLINQTLFLGNDKLGIMNGATEDICNSHYWRRGKTSLNINPNRRTTCHGCEFCYAIYQVPLDNKRLLTKEDFNLFFKKFLSQYNMTSMEKLIEISAVTGCYKDGEQLVEVLKNLRHVATEEYGFKGRILYLGSQINSEHLLEELAEIKPIRLCYSIETFERREILRQNKRYVSLQTISRLLDKARELGFEVNFSYVLGLETLDVVEKYFDAFKYSINQFPIVNTLQVHRLQSELLRADGADNIKFYLEARKIIESIFLKTNLRPEVWNNYRSLWTLKFADFDLTGVRTP